MFLQALFWEGVVVLKGLIFNNFYFSSIVLSCKGCFRQFLLWECVVGSCKD